MKKLTFQVLDGVDKGRVFRDLPIPVTIGREEGNVLRLTDDRISRFHAKIQHEDGDVILIDLESTNGTRINGAPVQIRRIRPGDQIGVGRSTLLFGTLEEIAARKIQQRPNTHMLDVPSGPTLPGTIHGDDLGFDLQAQLASASADPTPIWAHSDQDVPPLPQKLSPSQAARLAEIFDFLHRGLSISIEHVEIGEDATHVKIGSGEWQTILIVQSFLARYMRAIADPDLQLG